MQGHIDRREKSPPPRPPSINVKWNHLNLNFFLHLLIKGPLESEMISRCSSRKWSPSPTSCSSGSPPLGRGKASGPGPAQDSSSDNSVESLMRGQAHTLPRGSAHCLALLYLGTRAGYRVLVLQDTRKISSDAGQSGRTSDGRANRSGKAGSWPERGFWRFLSPAADIHPQLLCFCLWAPVSL